MAKAKNNGGTAVATKEDVVGELAMPETSTGEMAAFDELSKGGNFLERLQLGQGQTKAVQKKNVEIGNFFIPNGEDDGDDLGETVDLMVLCRRPKALDFSDREAIIENFEPSSDAFKRIQAASTEENSGCMYGVSLLVFEKTTGKFLEYYCSSKTSRPESRKIFPFLPRTKADVARDLRLAKEQGIDEKDVDGERKPQPFTLTSELIEKPSFAWYAARTTKCSQPFKNFPPMEKVVAVMTAFISRKSTEVVPDEEVAGNAPKR